MLFPFVFLLFCQTCFFLGSCGRSRCWSSGRSEGGRTGGDRGVNWLEDSSSNGLLTGVVRCDLGGGYRGGCFS